MNEASTAVPLPITQSAPRATTATVVSRDGTTIAYRAVGSGRPIVFLHGAMETSHSHLDLAEALADRARVILPDRRGRGMSGPASPTDGIAANVADLAAVLEATGARDVFGVSAGALVAGGGPDAASSRSGCLVRAAAVDRWLAVDGLARPVRP
jgi:pimeloyl-ACP methyl ester carboxylesterase